MQGVVVIRQEDLWKPVCLLLLLLLLFFFFFFLLLLLFFLVPVKCSCPSTLCRRYGPPFSRFPPTCLLEEEVSRSKSYLISFLLLTCSLLSAIVRQTHSLSGSRITWYMFCIPMYSFSSSFSSSSFPFLPPLPPPSPPLLLYYSLSAVIMLILSSQADVFPFYLFSLHSLMCVTFHLSSIFRFVTVFLIIIICIFFSNLRKEE